MLKFVRFFFLTLSIVSISLLQAGATHLRAGNITVIRNSPSGYSYTITLHVYTKASSIVKFGGGILNFGDGHTITTKPVTNPTIISEVDGGVGYVKYPVYHTFPGPGVYTITYYEQNRNGGILNLGGGSSDQIPFFIQTQIIIDDLLPGGPDNSPQLLVPPIDMGCTGVAWFHNPGAYDPDGDSLSYELYTPKQGAVYDVDGQYLSSVDASYVSPASPAFSQVTENGTPPPVFEINAKTGTIKWDSPGLAGEYNIAFIIREWRKIDGIWVPIGYVERDMQIIIQECDNKRPIIQVPPDVCVTAGDTVSGVFIATDPAVDPGNRTSGDGDSTKMEAFSQIFSINPSPATYTPFPVVWQPTTSDAQEAKLKIHWQTVCDHVKDQPYEVVVKATDNGSPHLASFETWKITVVAPAPQLISATLNPSKRTARLSWVKYTCAKNAAYIQVWRRVDSTTYTQIQCVTGMPASLGYSLIGQASKDSIGYTDKHLDVGARYCYRLVAVFPQPDGGESYVSNEVCMPPILADAPVVTNVSIDITDTALGQVTVKWRPPFEASATQFPPPYSYEVYRAEGLNGNINLVKAFSGRRPDTVWVDTGINTAETIYNYRILCYDNNGGFVDTSAVASTVRLELKPLFKQIGLTWFANVPWSNNTMTYPNHLIYRGTNSASKTITDLVLIDSVNVNQQQFTYLDTGRYNNTPLIPTQEYCYAVMTRGSYGNRKIKVPLVNFSEITCIIPNVQEKPCKPVVVASGIDCSNFNNCPVIGSSTYTNTLKWHRPTDQACRNEIRGYNVWAANSVGDEFIKINTTLVTDTFYVHSNLKSFAQCYKVSAVGRSGLESDLSDQFCFDNCPYYELPNVITPNGDGCNDKFSAFSIRNYGDDGWPCGYKFVLPQSEILDTLKNNKLDSTHFNNIKSRCARFVLGVSIKIYNRWGKEVYRYESGGENTIYIDWNGKDNNGHELDAGVYYYAANVIFDVVDPRNRNQTIKGWVQIIR